MIVQGSAKDPKEMNEAIDKVLKKVVINMNALSNATFADLKANLVEELKKKDENLQIRAGRVFKELSNNSNDFKRKSDLERTLAGLTKKDLIDFFQDTFVVHPKRVSIEVET